VTVRIADNGQLSLVPETVLRRIVLKAGKRGDTVTNVARRYGLAPAKVAEWNGVSTSAHFKPGQEIVVHRWVPVRPVQQTPVKVAARGSKPQTVRR
jgi:membrane-bound lytic murein transglycosylase D